ncbi:MAG TPA: TMEM43 family protein [Chthoniobacter sp.]|jgi:hypothetical protein
MPDQFVESSSQSWFSRIGGAIVGVIVGIILLPLSVTLHFWNEHRAVVSEKSLKEGAAAVISVPADSISPGNDRKLIHLTGDVTAGEPIHDGLFNVGAPALRLVRHVEVYQWKEDKTEETHKKLGGGEEHVTKYNYTKTWADKPIDSTTFKHPEDHTNPASFPVPTATVLSSKATLGAFKIPQNLIGKMQGGEPLSVTGDALTPLPPDLKSKAKIAGDGVYLGSNPEGPIVGDERVSFQVLNPGTFSFLAQQSGDTLAPYLTHEGGEIERVESGAMGADVMFQHAQNEAKILTWVLRVVGFVMMFVGFALIFNPLHVLADVVPFVGGIVGFGTGLLAALLGFAGSLVVIALAWLAARPLLGIVLLVIALAALIHSIARIRHHHQLAMAGKPA